MKRKALLLVVCLALVLVGVNVAYAGGPPSPIFPTFAQVRNMIAEAIQPLADDIADLAARLGLIETAVTASDAEIEALTSRVDALEASSADLDARLAALEAELHPVVEQSWTLAEDYTARPDATLPIVKDADGNDVWYFKQSVEATDPTAFQPMDTFSSWAPGMSTWRVGLSDTSVSANSSGADIILSWGGIFRAGTVIAHPEAPSRYPSIYTVMEWKSPFDGHGIASLSLKDMDPAWGSDGVEFWVLKNDTLMDHVAVPNGGTGSSDLSRTAINSGDSIYVVLGPGPAGSHAADTTVVDFTVSKVK